MHTIIETLPNGCLRIVDENGGAPYIETGDFERAQELLSAGDYAKVKALWTPELIAARKSELELQKQKEVHVNGDVF